MKDARKIITTILVFAAVIITLGILASILWTKSNFPGSGGALILLLIILLFGVMYLSGGLAEAKKGLPFQDERTKKILLHASSTAFTLSIWWLLILMYVSDEIEIIPRHVAAAGIVGMALLFFISWIWYNWRGAPE